MSQAKATLFAGFLVASGAMSSVFGDDAREQDFARRIAVLEGEIKEMKAREKDARDEGTERDMGFQLQLRFEWFTLAHNRRDDFFTQENAGTGTSSDGEQDGFGGGIGLRLPLWLKIVEKVDLLGWLDIMYRQNNNQPGARSVITGKTVTSSYANVIAGPMIRFTVTDVIRPFILLGGNLQVQTPPTDGVTYLDGGLTAGVGLDLRFTKKLSAGFDYKWSWFGAGDQEQSDYGALGLYAAFNF